MHYILTLFLLNVIGILSPQSQEAGVRFEIKNAGITVHGHFTDWSQDIRFNPRRLDKSYIHGKLTVSSIDTGIKMRDQHLQGRQYFNANKFPQISIHSQSLRLKGRNKYEGTFTVQIKDITKEVVIPFTATLRQNQYYFSATFTINRLDFALGESSVILSDDVKIMVNLTAVKT